jgi:hypothetical protein
MVKTQEEIIEILNGAAVFIEEVKPPWSSERSKRLKIQVPNDCGVTAKEYMAVITRDLVV